jgi:diacylglycerol kinase (ATP)
MAIIPIGSGNGLARHLQIPMNIREAISTINQMKIRAIDAARIDRKYFFNVAGFGFDGHISKLFAKTKKRGLSNYTNLVMKEFFKAKEEEYAVVFDNEKTLEGKSLMLSIANGAEFGNGFQVSPTSSLSDGYLELVITKKPGTLTFPNLVMNALKGNVHTSKFVSTYRFKKMIILKAANSFHADGEPISVKFPVEIEVKPKALLIIAGENYI